MKRVPLKFSFKGDRNYIRGTDIYNQMLQQIESLYDRQMVRTVRLEFHSFVSKQCAMIVGDAGETLPKPDDAVADLQIDTAEGKVVSWLIESNKGIEDRYDYDESRIEALCRITGQKIVIADDCGYSPIEVAVSMTKHLHNRLFPRDKARWIFTRLELARPLERADSCKLAVSLKHNFNDRLTKSELLSGEESIGYIYFSVVKR